MATEESASTVVGVFRRHAEAERAVNKLVASGFPAQDIGFLGPGAVSLDAVAGFALPVELSLIFLFAGLAAGLLTIPLSETADRPSTQS